MTSKDGYITTKKHHGEHKKSTEHPHKKGFHPFGPPPPPRHAHCAIQAEFEHPCDDLWMAIAKDIKGMHPGSDHPDPAGGTYMLVKEVKDKSIIANRTESWG
jgi:hypothetical protein